ncbi:MAG TPA: hypothetical protein VFN19_04575 [Candidatus Nanopelagicales bacterium]|jgi:hypothetical protein|nr:hypothetical protein [Candidatus Nanopelagicales bacterium]
MDERTTPPASRRPTEPVVPQVPADAMVLHIGTHKTGTTALQSALKARQDQLRELGVTYPLSHRAQHRACMALVEREFGWERTRSTESFHRGWDKFAGKVAPIRGRVLISSEWLCQADDAQAERAVTSLGRDRVQVLVAFRSLGRILPSSWQQYLKNGWTATFEEWLGYVLADPPSPKANSSFWQRNDVPATLRRWSALLGPDRITVVVADEGERTLLPDTLADLLGVPREVLAAPPEANVRSNRSLSVPESELLLAVNPAARDMMRAAQYTALVRNGAAERMVEGRWPGPDEARLTIPPWAADRVAELASSHAEALRTSGVRVVGDPAALTRPPELGEPQRPTDLPVEAAALALLGTLQVAHGRSGRSVASLSTRELLAEVARRTRRRLPLGAKSTTDQP